MNDVLDFLKDVRTAANIYLWFVFAVATVLLVGELTKGRAARADHEESRESKAA